MSDRLVFWATVAMTVINLLLTVFYSVLRWLDRPPPPAAHPLAPELRAIAAAIRERAPDFHLRLDDKEDRR